MGLEYNFGVKCEIGRDGAVNAVNWVFCRRRGRLSVAR